MDSKATDQFLEFFYKEYSESLFSPLLQVDAIEPSLQEDGTSCLVLEPHSVALLEQLCILLGFIVTYHAMFSKNFYLSHEGILKSVTLLLKAKETHLKLAALRVLRISLGTKDEFYRRLLIKLDVFGPIFRTLLDTGGRYNVLNSACLEFFDFIRKVWFRLIVDARR